MNYRILLIAPLAAAVFSVGAASPLRMPAGWFSFQNTSPSDTSLMPRVASEGYEIGIDPASEASGLPSLTVRSRVAQAPGPVSFGTVQQTLSGYGGKRVRFSGQVRTDGLRGWGGIFLGPGDVTLLARLPTAASGIEAQLPAGSPVAGDGGWHEASVVLDVPADAAVITFGLAVVGEGQAWARNLQFQIVGPDVAPTSTTMSVDLQAARRHIVDANAALAKLAIPPVPLKNAALD